MKKQIPSIIHEYVREGTVSSFMLASPLEGTREIFVAPDGRRTAVDYALAMDYLAEKIYPDAKKIVIVQNWPPPEKVVHVE